MADPLQNAAFAASLFRPVTDSIAGFGEADAKVAQLGYQDRLRILKRQQEEADAARDFDYRKALVNLQVEGQKAIADESTRRTIKANEIQTDRALQQQREMTARAEEMATAKELAAAKAQYRLLAGPKAKSIDDFGDTPAQQLDGINQELSRLNDDKAKSAASIYLRTQKALDEEMTRITTVTDKDEASLVANALSSITNKDAREKLAKFKGATNAASILTFLAPLYPSAAQEFSAGYEAAKDAIINNRSKGSKISSLQRDLQYKATLLKDPSVLNYVALGLPEEGLPGTAAPARDPSNLDDLFGTKRTPPPGTAPVNAPTIPVKVPPAALPPPLPAFQSTPDDADNIMGRRNDAFRENVFLRPFQSVGNVLSPSNWQSRNNGDALVYNPTAENQVESLLTRLRYINDRNSPRGVDVRNQLYDLTSPAAYINSRPNYFAGSR